MSSLDYSTLEAFKSLDLFNLGYVTFDSLNLFMKQQGVSLLLEEADAFFRAVDLDEDGNLLPGKTTPSGNSPSSHSPRNHSSSFFKYCLIVTYWKGTLLKTFYGHDDFVRSLSLTKEGNIVSCSDDKTIKIWNIDTGLPFNLPHL